MKGYIPGMPRKPSPPPAAAGPNSRWVYQAVLASGLSYADLAKALHKAGAINSPDKSVPQKIVNGDRLLKPDEMDAIAEATGYPKPGQPNDAMLAELVRVFDQLDPAMKPVAIQQVSALVPLKSPTPPADARPEAGKER